MENPNHPPTPEQVTYAARLNLELPKDATKAQASNILGTKVLEMNLATITELNIRVGQELVYKRRSVRITKVNQETGRVSYQFVGENGQLTRERALSVPAHRLRAVLGNRTNTQKAGVAAPDSPTESAPSAPAARSDSARSGRASRGVSDDTVVGYLGSMSPAQIRLWAALQGITISDPPTMEEMSRLIEVGKTVLRNQQH